MPEVYVLDKRSNLADERSIWSELREVYSYNEHTGRIYYRVTRGPRAMAGDEAGTIDERGRYRIMYKKKSFPGGKLAWFLKTGEYPDVIVYRNGDRRDIRFANLSTDPWDRTYKRDLRRVLPYETGKGVQGLTAVL